MAANALLALLITKKRTTLPVKGIISNPEEAVLNSEKSVLDSETSSLSNCKIAISMSETIRWFA